MIVVKRLPSGRCRVSIGHCDRRVNRFAIYRIPDTQIEEYHWLPAALITLGFKRLCLASTHECLEWHISARRTAGVEYWALPPNQQWLCSATFLAELDSNNAID